MTDSKMAERTVCKFYNTGYFKLTNKCKFEHPKTNAQKYNVKVSHAKKGTPSSADTKNNAENKLVAYTTMKNSTRSLSSQLKISKIRLRS